MDADLSPDSKLCTDQKWNPADSRLSNHRGLSVTQHEFAGYARTISSTASGAWNWKLRLWLKNSIGLS